MRRIIPWLCLLMPYFACGQNCGLPNNISIPNNDSISIPLEIFDIVNGDLSDPQQGVCAVRLDFQTSNITHFEVWLTSPAGQRVQLMGPNAGGGFLLGALFDVSFVPDSVTALPDLGQDQIWDHNVNKYTNSGNFTGSYYPFQGSLEDFNTGPVNGTWLLEIRNDPTSIGFNGLNTLFDVKVELCDPFGENCCLADAGSLAGQADLQACAGDSSLKLSASPDYTAAPPDTSVYEYTFAIGLDSLLLRYDSTADLRDLPAGNYQICGLSYQRDQ